MHDRNPATPQAGLDCEGEHCTIHNPSDHHMNTWPIARGGERVCPHGIGHPDPDYLAWLNRVQPDNSGDIHGCDGCCSTSPPTIRRLCQPIEETE